MEINSKEQVYESILELVQVDKRIQSVKESQKDCYNLEQLEQNTNELSVVENSRINIHVELEKNVNQGHCFEICKSLLKTFKELIKKVPATGSYYQISRSQSKMEEETFKAMIIQIVINPFENYKNLFSNHLLLTPRDSKDAFESSILTSFFEKEISFLSSFNKVNCIIIKDYLNNFFERLSNI